MTRRSLFGLFAVAPVIAAAPMASVVALTLKPVRKTFFGGVSGFAQTEIIERALRLIGALLPGESLSATELACHGRTLNQLVGSWNIPIPLAMEQPAGFFRMAAWNLAKELMPEYCYGVNCYQRFEMIEAGAREAKCQFFALRKP